MYKSITILRKIRCFQVGVLKSKKIAFWYYLKKFSRDQKLSILWHFGTDSPVAKINSKFPSFIANFFLKFCVGMCIFDFVFSQFSKKILKNFNYSVTQNSVSEQINPPSSCCFFFKQHLVPDKLLRTTVFILLGGNLVQSYYYTSCSNIRNQSPIHDPNYKL